MAVGQPVCNEEGRFNMKESQTQLQSDTWVDATWEEYIQAIANPAYEKAKGYYYDGQLRIEMPPVGPDHSRDNSIIVVALNLFGIVRGIPLNSLTNCSYRRTGVQECQPDASYYIGERAQLAPRGAAVVDLNIFQAPDLVIAVANTSLADDLDRKKTLYQELGVREYWVVDVQNSRIIAFAIVEGNSQQVIQSQVLPGLTMALLEEALRRSRQVDQTQVGTWLLQQMQAF